MKDIRCPYCKGRFTLEQLLLDQTRTELLSLIFRLPPELFPTIMPYLGLFRSGDRDLTDDKALKLLQEVLSLYPDATILAIAMSETIEAIRAKEQNKPLKNHNYLKQVIESVATRNCSVPMPHTGLTQRKLPAQVSKTLQGLESLYELKQEFNK